MMAALLRRHVLRCLSRQLYERLMRPPVNHSACGGSHLRTVSHFLNQSSSKAIRAQKSSGDAAASAYNRSYSSIELTSAPSEKVSGGGKTRFSCCSDSMFGVTDDITLFVAPLWIG